MKCELCKKKKAIGIAPTRGEFPEPVLVCETCALSLPGIEQDGFPLFHFKSENGFWYFVFIHSKYLYPYFYPSSRPDFRHLDKDKFAKLLKMRDFDKKICKRISPYEYDNRKEKEDILYFAYGSEINRNILKKLKIKFRPVEKGQIFGCRLEFCRENEADTVSVTLTMGEEKEYVEGMIYLLESEKEFHKLDKFLNIEQNKYQLRKILAHMESGQPALVMLYIYTGKEKIKKPDKRYLNHMIKGAKQNNLGKEWIEKLERLKSEW